MLRAWECHMDKMAVLIEDALPENIVQVHRPRDETPQVHETTFGVTSNVCRLHEEMLGVFHTSHPAIVNYTTIAGVDDNWLHGTMTDEVKNSAQLKKRGAFTFVVEYFLHLFICAVWEELP